MEMEEFRCYKKMSFNFSPNRFCVITGPNGIGKTTLFDCLCWISYDETTKGRKGDSVIRKRSGKNTKGILCFDIGKDHYRIENYREHHEFGNSKFLIKNEIDISGSNRTETNRRIEDILMPKEVFKNCLLFSQYIDKPFAEMGDTGQKNVFDLMMGFGKYAYYYDGCKHGIKEIEAAIEKLNEEDLLLNQSFVRNKELLGEELLVADEMIGVYRDRKEFLESKMEELVKRKEFLSEKVLPYSDLKRELGKIQNDLTEINAKIFVIKDNFNKDKVILSNRIEMEKKENINTVRDNFRETVEAIKKELEEIEHSYELFRQKVLSENENLKAKFFERKTNIEVPLHRSRDKLIGEQRAVLQQIENLQDSLRAEDDGYYDLNKGVTEKEKLLSKDVPICYACKQKLLGSSVEEIKADIDKDRQKLTEAEEKIKKLSDQIDKLETRESKHESELRCIKEKLCNELEQLENWKRIEVNKLQTYKDTELTNLQKKKSMAFTKQNSVEKEMRTAIENEEEICSKKLNEETSKLNAKFHSVTATLNKNTVEVKSKIDEVEKEIRKLQELKDIINSNDGTQNAIKSELTRLIPDHEIALRESNKKLGKLKKIVEEDDRRKSSIEDRIIKLERKLSITKFWKKAFSPKGIKAILLDESIPILNKKALELSAQTECIRVRFDSQKPLKSGEYRNQFCVLPIQTRNLTDERSDFSQGEGRMVDIITLLSLRYLLEVTYDRCFNISLFDEILDSLYVDNADIVINFLRKMSESSCTVLITHTLRNNVDPDEHLEL